jgi:hypothetical protein
MDLVMVQKANDLADLNLDTIIHVEAWMQIHNVSPKVIFEHDIQLITTQVGEVISNVWQGFIGGKRFYKVKISLSLSQGLKD